MKLARRYTIRRDSLRPRELALLQLLADRPGLMRGEYAELLGVLPNSAGAYLDALMVAGLAHSKGIGRGATWWPGERPEVIQMARRPTISSVWEMA